MSEWQWKQKSGSSQGLLYEPGNWGDLIKGEWLLRVAEFISKTQTTSAQAETFEYLDLFCGLPDYPASSACLRRVAHLPEEFLLKKHAEALLEAGRWPSAAGLMLNFPRAEVTVFDQDHLRRSEWGPGVDCLDLNDGWDFLPLPPETPYKLLLLDPYDFLADWRDTFKRLTACAASCPVLLYVYNRSGKNRERLRDYRMFVNRLRDCGLRAYFARVAADSFIPDCWHEMFFFPHKLAQEAGFDRLVDALENISLLLQDVVRAEGIFGEI